MAETANTAEIAKKIAKDIFSVFFWELRKIEDTNFECVLEHHVTDTNKQKLSHPCDVLFTYHDPYLNKSVYLHTDLKSYAKNTLTRTDITKSIKSLGLTLECAHVSGEWRKYLKEVGEQYDIRGLLFVANHDGKAPLDFNERLSKMSKKDLLVAKSQVVHILGPKQISDLFSIATDIKLLISDGSLSPHYRFFYPDLTLWKRGQADDVRTAATIETLLSPYFVIRHNEIVENGNKILWAGSLIYYSRKGETVDEFVYLLDSLSRYQLVKADEKIRIRMFNTERDSNFKSNFDKAKNKYCRIWSFESTRTQEIADITIDALNQFVPNYSPAEIGWKES